MALPVFQRTIVNSAGDVIPSAQITVIDETTGVAPSGGLFSDRAGTIPLGAGGVFSTGADGFAQFYVAKGTYRVTALDLGTALSQTWRYVVLINSDVYAPDNILGPVSQSGGVPTGAIFQLVTNGFGTARKYADGFCIQEILFTDAIVADTNVIKSIPVELTAFWGASCSITPAVTAVVGDYIVWAQNLLEVVFRTKVNIPAGNLYRITIFGNWY